MRRCIGLWISMVLVAVTLGCGAGDGAPAGGADVLSSTDADTEDAQRDEASPGPDADGPMCELPADCAPGGDCRRGQCVATMACQKRWDCADDEICVAQRCIRYCEADSDCPAAASCHDGECQAYPRDLWDAPELAPSGAAGLSVGVARVELDYPLGVSMAGYGWRDGSVQSPYRRSVVGSDRELDRMNVKAIALDDGRERLVVVRSPTGWVTDYMVSLTAHKLNELQGHDYLDRLVVLGTHSHSTPGRFERLGNGYPVGQFGLTDFSIEITERLTDSLAAAADAALRDLTPGRFGYATRGSVDGESFDPEDRITADRRASNAPFKYPRMTVLRFDDDEGLPRAVVVHLALHPAYLVGTWISGDASAAIELEAEERLRERYGRDVPVIHWNGPAGDVSAHTDDLVYPPWGGMQLVGYRVWPLVDELMSEADGTRSDVTLKRGIRRYPLSYERVGYDPEMPHAADDGTGEFYDTEWGTHAGRPYYFGAYMCVSGDDEDPATQHSDGNLFCLMNAEDMMGSPLDPLMRTRLAAFSLDDLLLLTLPGEPLSRYGVELEEEVRRRTGAALALVLGYGMHYNFYLTTPDDWWQGGYEAASSTWGWKLAGHLAELAADLAEAVWNGDDLPADEMKPSWWPGRVEELRRKGWLSDEQPWTEEPWREVAWWPTPSAEAGQALVEPAAEVRRLDVVSFTWRGGFSGCDHPRVVLERQEGETFTPVLRPDGEPYDDAGFAFLLHFRGWERETQYTGTNSWSIHWQEGAAFPLGTYRFHVTGHYYDGGTPGVATPYEVVSGPFALQPRSDADLIEHRREGDELVLTVAYPAPPTNDDGASSFEALEPAGFHVVFPRVDGFFGGPLPNSGLDVRVDGAGVSAEVTEVTVARDYVAARSEDGDETIATRPSLATELRLPWPGPGSHAVTVDDGLGNTLQMAVNL